MRELREQRVLVMGLGRFGGGVGVARWLVSQAARVTVTDVADEPALRDSVAQLAGLDVAFHLGGHKQKDLDETDLLVVNPAVDKRESAFFRAAVERGIPWTSEMTLFLERCPSRIVGITGTAGKSTTCAMVYHVLSAAVQAGQAPFSRAWLGGNIGRSLLGDLAAMSRDDLVVLELSSFQLEDAAEIRWSPAVAAILNVSPNHFDRHGDMTGYLAAKLNIVRYQRAGDFVVVGPDDPLLLGRVVDVTECTGARVMQAPDGASFELRAAGRHNQTNAACASALCTILGIDGDTVRESLSTFHALPHRLQHVRTFRGVGYYNDSKSTTPQATITAVEALEGPLVVIVGGYDKGLPLEAMAGQLARRARAVLCYGAAGSRYAAAVTDARGSRAAPCVERVETLADAIASARSLAQAGDVVLLSPGCSSFDEFANYEHRGQAFVDEVNAWME